MPRLAIIGEFDPTFRPHAATNAAIEHVTASHGLQLAADWVSAADITDSLFDAYSAIWVAPGSPYKSLERTLWAIRHARENGVPCFGTCGGFQHIVLEHARNVLGFQDAQHAEYDPYASDLFVSELACSLAGREMLLHFSPNSLVARVYGGVSAVEQYYCNFGVHPEKVGLLKNGPLQVTGWDAEGELRVLELPGHPFFVGTLFVPQARSTAERPHPLVAAFLNAVATARSDRQTSVN